MATGTITVSNKAEVQLATRLGFDPADFRTSAVVRCTRNYETTRTGDYVYAYELRVAGVAWDAKGNAVFIWQESDMGPKVRVRPLGPWTLILTKA